MTSDWLIFTFLSNRNTQKTAIQQHTEGVQMDRQHQMESLQVDTFSLRQNYLEKIISGLIMMINQV